jgi:hypothetical protein
VTAASDPRLRARAIAPFDVVLDAGPAWSGGVASPRTVQEYEAVVSSVLPDVQPPGGFRRPLGVSRMTARHACRLRRRDE